MISKSKINARDIALCALFAALIAVGAYIKIPTPPVPITLQTFFVITAGFTLGGRLGAVSALCYMAIGLAGLPVFTGGGGLSYVFSPTFGYIIGFCAGAFLAGAIAGKKPHPSFLRLFMASLAAIAVIYAFGVGYFYMIKTLYEGVTVVLRNLFIYCFLVFLPGDIAFGALAAFLGRRLIPILKKARGE